MSWVAVLTTGEPDSELRHVVGPFDSSEAAEDYLGEHAADDEYGEVKFLEAP